MATTYTWAITNLERETADGFVFTVHYTVDAKDDAYSAGVYGSIGLDRPDNLTPYAELTEELMVGWVKDKLGEEQTASIETALQAQIDEQKTPAKGTGMPWAS